MLRFQFFYQTPTKPVGSRRELHVVANLMDIARPDATQLNWTVELRRRRRLGLRLTNHHIEDDVFSAVDHWQSDVGLLSSDSDIASSLADEVLSTTVEPKTNHSLKSQETRSQTSRQKYWLFCVTK